MLTQILHTIRLTGRVYYLDVDTWQKGGEVIAGFTHLSKTDQLWRWAKANNLCIAYEAKMDAYALWPNNQTLAQPGRTSEMVSRTIKLTRGGNLQ